MTARTLADVAAERIALTRNGFAPVPIRSGDKRPSETAWPDRARALLQPGAELPAPAPDALNTGILCDGLRALDLDIDHAAMAEAVRALAEQHLGGTIARTRHDSPRCLLLYRAAAGSPRKLTAAGQGGKIEALGAGQQFVAFGTHPGGASLEWEPIGPDAVAREMLPAITEAQLAGFMAAAAPLIGAEASPTLAEPGASAPSVTQRTPPSVAAVVTLLARLPNPASLGRDRYLAVMLGSVGCIDALRAADALGENGEAQIAGAAVSWAARWEGPGRGAAYEAAKWAEDWSGRAAPLAAWQTLEREAAALIPEYRADATRDALAGVVVLPPESDRPTASRLRLLSPSDCEGSPSRSYVVKGLLSAGDVACVFGAPGAGKSVLAPHLAYAVAQGRQAFGRRTRSGRVFYVPAEDQAGMRCRVHALKLRHGDAPLLSVVEGASALLDAARLDELAALVTEHRPALIVLDTLAAAFPGMEENGSRDMGLVVAGARRLAAHGAAVLLIHHDTKDAGGTPRGHSVLNGALDMALLVTREADGRVLGRLTKNRNGDCDALLGFRIEPVRLGHDADGDAITAPIAAELDPASLKPKAKLPAAEAAALDLLRALALDSGTEAPDGSDAPAAPETAWREACKASATLSAAEAPDNRRRATDRAIAGLTRKKIVALVAGLAWETNQSNPTALRVRADFADVRVAPPERMH